MLMCGAPARPTVKVPCASPSLAAKATFTFHPRRPDPQDELYLLRGLAASELMWPPLLLLFAEA